MNTLIRVIAISVAAIVAGCGGDVAQTPPAPKSAMRMAAAPSAEIQIAGYRANYTISKARDTGVVTLTNKLTKEVLTYQSPSLIKFVDSYTSFDVDGVAGQVYRLYQAAFNRQPDLQGLGFWIAAYRNGRDLLGIASDFIAAKEFSDSYGANVSDTALIDLLYNNILHRAGEASGVAWWRAAMAGGASRAAVLYGFSDSPENAANLNAALVGGFDYLPYQAGGPIIPKPTSYANAKIGNEVVNLPPGEEGDSAFALADFKQNGQMTLFTTRLTYHPERPVGEATPGIFAFWSRDASGKWTRESSLIDTPDGCLHPRKAAVADINADGKPDIVVACHGYDALPFPGEKIWLVLSTPEGIYKSAPMGEYTGFFHSVSVADINNDGLPDIVATDNFTESSLRVFLNQNGAFKEVTGLTSAAISWRGYYSVELVDIDLDGKLDLLFGGHDFDRAPVTIVYGDGGMDFSKGRMTEFQPVSGYGVALDFVVRPEAKAIYVARTSGGDGTFYQGAAIQKINTVSGESTFVYQSRSAQWFALMIETPTGVASQDASRPIEAKF